MSAIRSDRDAACAKLKVWPLVGALVAAGLATVLLGGCAMTMTDGKSGSADLPTVKFRAAPLVVRGEKSPDAYYALGKYYFYQGRLEQARDAFLEAVRLDPNHVDALNGLGVVYDRQGQYEAARKAYEAALLKDPQAAHVWANLGYSLILAGKNGESVAPLQKAVALDPANALARRHLASVRALADTVAAAPPAAQPQIAATAVDATQAQAAKTAAPAGPVASIVTAERAEPAKLVPVLTSSVSSISSSGNVASERPARIDGVRQAEPPVPPAGTAAQVAPKPPASIIASAPKPPASIIASVAKPAHAEGEPLVEKAVPVPAVSPESSGPKFVAAMTVPQPPMPEAGDHAGLKGLRIEVSNGNGVTGMARAVGKEMRQTGLNIARVTNARPFNKPRTLILCRPELKSTAMALAQTMPAKPRIVLRDIAYRNVDVRVVLGADSALARGSGSPYLVAGLGK